jgi:hypothetical protein
MKAPMARKTLMGSTCLILAMTAFGCGKRQEPSSSSLKEEWNEQNDPLNFLPTDFERKFAALPTASTLEKAPWSDSYWPSYLGGIALRWNTPFNYYEDSFRYRALPYRRIRRMGPAQLAGLSPAEKFDLLNGDYNYTLLNSERSRTGRNSPTWEGLCHGWASAALTLEEPKAVLMTNADGIEIPFGAADVKALIDLYVGNFSDSRTYFVAERCNVDLSRNPSAAVSPECRDTNAGTFHLVLTNQIGIKREGFVADITRDLQVWNHPVYGYESRVVSEVDGASPGAATGTVKEITLETVMQFISEAGSHWESGITNTPSRTYNYRIELNADGQIIGGAWLTEDRPDFIWKQDPPEFMDVGPLRFSSLKTLYENSIRSTTVLANPIGR